MTGAHFSAYSFCASKKSKQRNTPSVSQREEGNKDQSQKRVNKQSIRLTI
jgi:hypothetical protein